MSARHSTTASESTASAAVRRAGVARAQHARIDEQPAVAVLGEAGQIVEAGDGDSRLLQRLDEGVGEPLGELVEWHQPVGRVAGADGAMAPHVAQVDAAEGEAAGPDIRESLQHASEDGLGRNRPVPRPCRQVVEEAARPGRVGAEERRVGAQAPAQPAEERHASRQARKRVVRPGPEAARQVRFREPRQGLGVGAAGIRRVGREEPAREHLQTGRGEPFRAPESGAAQGFTVAPVRAGAGVEQDARDREVETPPRSFRRACVGHVRGQACPAVHPAGLEMAPAAVVGDIEAGIGLSDDREHIAGRRVELLRMDAEVIEPPVLRGGEDDGASRAHRGGRSQGAERRVDVGEAGRA